VAAGLLAGAVMTVPPVAVAQDGTPTPSARELWKTYPLRQEPAARKAREHPATGASGRRASARSSAPAGGDAPLPLLGTAAALAALGGALVLRRRRASRRSGAPADLGMPLLAVAVTTAAMPPRRRPATRLTALTGDTGENGRERPGSEEALRPPESAQPWVAELEWRDERGGPRFWIVAHPAGGGPEVRIASSEPIEWPPPDAVAVQRLRGAVARMEAGMRSAGWTPLPPGEAWYSKRFAWTPVAEPASAPPPGPADTLFEPQPAWPPDTERLWRCEIRWRGRYVNSRFTAVAREPGRRGSTTVGTSKAFKWLIMADPDPESPEFRDAAEQLDEQITAAGWEPAGLGRDWWARRYVWRRDGPPRLDLDPAPARIGKARERGDDDDG
jgi:hypothetical protein